MKHQLRIIYQDEQGDTHTFATFDRMAHHDARAKILDACKYALGKVYGEKAAKTARISI